MNRHLLLFFLLCFVLEVPAQVSFAPIDSLYDADASRRSTYLQGNVFQIDFNRDGFDDILVLKGKALYLRLNTKTNSFAEETPLYTDEDIIYSISNFVDINLDSYPDVAIATFEGTKILYATNDGFVIAHQSPDDVYFGRLVLLDKNNDGKVDLASSNAHDIRLYDDVATGLNQKSLFYTDVELIHDFHIGDLNADNEQDLIVSAFRKALKVHLGNADGTLSLRFSKLINDLAVWKVADLNLDGFRDIAYAEERNNLFTLTYDNATKTFKEEPVFTEDPKPANASNFNLIDLKNDGTTDLVYTHFSNLVVRENNGSGGFLPPKILTGTLFVPSNSSSFDFNDDTQGDLLACDASKFHLVSFKADGTVDISLTDGYHPEYKDVISHDLDKDGFKDVVTVSVTGSLQIRWGNPDHDYTRNTKYRVPFGTNYAAVVDINSDGNDDLLITEESVAAGVNRIAVLEGKGNREFEAARPWKYFPDPAKPLIADVNNDGIPDVITYARNTKEIFWLDIANADYNEYSSSVRKIQVTGERIAGLACSDINGDAYPDLLTANLTSKNVSVLINNQNGSFDETILTPDGPVTFVYGVSTFDYNEDGHPDLLVIVRNEAVHGLQVFLNDQSGNFAFSNSHPLNDFYHPVHVDVMDMDADQDLDFIVSSSDYSDTNVFIREDGAMKNVGPEIITSCGQSARIYDDLNHDGKPDVVSANYFDGGTFLQLNNSVLPPAQVETQISIEETGINSVRFNLTETNSAGLLVVITSGEDLAAIPADNNFYTANRVFGIGSSLGEQSYVTHLGTAESLEVTGLSSCTRYLISVFEYNVNDPQVTIINYTENKVQKAFVTRNAPPQVAAIPDQEGANLQTISVPLDITDTDNPVDAFSYEITSSDESVIPVSNVAVTTTGDQPVLALTPADFGVSMIELTVTDTANNSVAVRFSYTSLVVGIEKPATSRLTVYPNPFQTGVEVAYAGNTEWNQLEIYNSNGVLIKQFPFIPSMIDLSGYPAGLYLFKTKDGNHRVLKR